MDNKNFKEGDFVKIVADCVCHDIPLGKVVQLHFQYDSELWYVVGSDMVVYVDDIEPYDGKELVVKPDKLRKIKVYIASQYTIGDAFENTRRQIDMADKLMDLGFLTFAPVMFSFHHLIHPRSYENWMEIDLAWVSQCDCVLRLEGESKGADKEAAHANDLGKMVFYSVDDLISYYEND